MNAVHFLGYFHLGYLTIYSFWDELVRESRAQTPVFRANTGIARAMRTTFTRSAGTLSSLSLQGVYPKSIP
jgi:hypothetical protein